MEKNTVQLISFLSGLTITAVVIGVTISKSPKIRGEIESQLNTCLKATRTMSDAYKNLAFRSRTASSFITNDAGEKTPREEAAETEAAERANSQWDTVEAQAAS